MYLIRISEDQAEMIIEALSREISRVEDIIKEMSIEKDEHGMASHQNAAGKIGKLDNIIYNLKIAEEFEED